MLQVDENIGGRQDQKNQNLPTKMLAVGLLMLVGVGCFVVGFFSVTTTNTANTAHTRVSSPKGNFLSYIPTNSIANILFHAFPAISRSINSCIFVFYKTQPVTHSLAPAKSMAWSRIYKIIRTSILQTRHRTIPPVSLFGLMVHLVTPILLLVLTTEIHGLQTNVRVVWWGKFLPSSTFPRGHWPRSITRSSVLRISARGRVIRSFLF